MKTVRIGCSLVMLCISIKCVAQPVAFVGVDNGGTNSIYSQDGINWNASPVGMPGSVYWERVLFGGGNYVAVAWGATNSGLTSTGTNWVAGGALPAASDWVGLAYGNNTFVTAAYGSGVGAYSLDGGTNWLTSIYPRHMIPTSIMHKTIENIGDLKDVMSI